MDTNSQSETRHTRRQYDFSAGTHDTHILHFSGGIMSSWNMLYWVRLCNRSSYTLNTNAWFGFLLPTSWPIHLTKSRIICSDPFSTPWLSLNSKPKFLLCLIPPSHCDSYFPACVWFPISVFKTQERKSRRLREGDGCQNGTHTNTHACTLLF